MNDLPKEEAKRRHTSAPINRLEGLLLDALNHAERALLVQLALAELADRHAVGRRLPSGADTQAYLRLRMSHLPRESFGALFLDNQHRLLSDESLFSGTVGRTTVHPRVLVQRALAVNAAALVVYHNHPSGVPEPSRADRLLTRQVKDACQLIDVRVLDHLVVGAEGVVSFAERGWL